MTKLYLIRHAEAEGNLYRRIHGHYDSILTENGRQQLRFLKERFSNIALHAVYSSDLCRARKTAEAVAQEKGLPVETRTDLREVAMGIWEDQPWGEVERSDAEGMAFFRASSPKWKVKGGEAFAALQARVSAALLDLAAQHEGETIAVASHGMAIRFACGALMGLSVEECHSLGHSDNTAVTLLEIEDGRGRIVFSDDNTHLPKEYSTLARQTWWKDSTRIVLDENLHFEPMNFSELLYKGLYLASRQEGWVALGRDMSHFGRQNYLDDAEACSRQNPKHVLCALQGNSIVGILQLDTERGTEDNAGYITFFYMLPEFRGNGLGIQLLGEAVSVFRDLGRDRMRLSCGEDNPSGMRFYERYGFHSIGSSEQPFGALCLMEKYIGFD